MGQLIGTEPTVNVPCTAKFIDGKKCKPVSFIAVFTRLFRDSRKALFEEFQEKIKQAKKLGLEAVRLENEEDSDDVGEERLTEIEQRKEQIKVELDDIDNFWLDKILIHLKDIKNLKLSDGSIAKYCDELVAEMLSHDGYFNALREGLQRSSGVFFEEKQKNS
mgnify:CR=1 FL=1